MSEEKKIEKDGLEPVQKKAVYTVKELAAASRKQFKCSSEMVMAAFLYAGKKEATLAEAKNIVSKFRKEV